MRNPKWVAIASGLVVCLVGLTAVAQELPLNVFAPSLEEEIEDLLFLGDVRPVLIRLHIRIDGMGHRQRWNEFVRRMHFEADTDRDGVVSRVEARFVIDRTYPLATATTFSGRAPARRQILIPPAIVTFDDLAEQMETVIKPFEVVRLAPPTPSDNETTFRLLDRDGDGFLTASELATATSSLARLDVDDDEALSAEELGPYPGPSNNAVIVRTRNGATVGTSSGSVVSASGSNPRDMALLIIQRYTGSPTTGVQLGRAANSRRVSVQAGELPIEAEAFARIDSNRDKSLDADELAHAINNAADVELVVRIGRREPGEPAIERLENGAGRPSFGTPSVRRVGDLMFVELASTVLEVGGSDPLATTREELERWYRSADLDGNGYLDRTEMYRSPQLTPLLNMADRNGDNKLTEAEWRAQIDRTAGVVGLRTLLEASDQSPSFLDLLDTNQDRKLSSRELRATARRILVEDRDGDDRVSRREFASHYRWTLTRGSASNNGQPPILVDQRPVRPAGSFNAPEWFLKMDRNRDGDLSPREFLGSRAIFAGYDADRDGLIDSAEAIRRH